MHRKCNFLLFTIFDIRKIFLEVKTLIEHYIINLYFILL